MKYVYKKVTMMVMKHKIHYMLSYMKLHKRFKIKRGFHCVEGG